MVASSPVDVLIQIAHFGNTEKSAPKEEECVTRSFSLATQQLCRSVTLSLCHCVALPICRPAALSLSRFCRITNQSQDSKNLHGDFSSIFDKKDADYWSSVDAFSSGSQFVKSSHSYNA